MNNNEDIDSEVEKLLELLDSEKDNNSDNFEKSILEGFINFDQNDENDANCNYEFFKNLNENNK